jgi:hypothetical protein
MSSSKYNAAVPTDSYVPRDCCLLIERIRESLPSSISIVNCEHITGVASAKSMADKPILEIISFRSPAKSHPQICGRAMEGEWTTVRFEEVVRWYLYCCRY